MSATIAPSSNHALSARWALVSKSLTMLLSSLGTSIANVGLPALAEAFHASFGQVQWVVIAYLLSITTLIVSAGRLGDLMGRRRLLLGGIVLFIAASAMCGMAPTLSMLIAARAAQGIGAAIMMALTMAFVSGTVDKAKTGSAMGLLGTMSAVGTALGPSLGGVLIGGLGWQSMFLVNVPLGLMAFALAWRYLPADRPSAAQRQRFDYLGALLLALTLAAYALATTARPDSGRGLGGTNMVLLAGAGLGLGLFVWAQARAASPLVPLQMLRKAGLRASLVMNALVSTVMMATLVVGPFYLSGALGLNLAVVGVVMSTGPALSAISGVPAGRMVDRWGAPSMVLAGIAAMAVGTLALSLLPRWFGVAGYIAAIAVLTPGYQLFQAANNTAVMTGVHPEQRGVMSGVLNLSRNLGLITGASAMGAVFAWASHSRDITHALPADVASGMQVTFAVATVLVVVALVIMVGGRALARRRFNGTGAMDPGSSPG
ncbi:MAG TPA: MFS transporter [Polaromonas sp.]|uniref:MFS transporter n=1 Tax=Polaromonas sp. TaxID=1869339 RepID=UPI002D5F9993|nr:MFS transporter [Polaromonas sp.]HYW57528.1 MFS transporter [Polaromonas sp.]